MRNLLSLAIVLALPMAASAGEQDCLVSFSGAQQNVCTGESTTSASTLQGLLSLDAVKDSTLRLVKFGAPITEAQRAAVEAAGAKVISYAPHYAYIVRMPAGLDGAMRAVDGVVWSGPLMPALKVDPNIYSELQGNRIVDGLGITTLEISIDAQANGSAMRSAIAAIPGLSVTNTVTSGGETRLLAGFSRAQLGAAIEELAVNPDVLAIGFRKPMRLNNSQGHWLHQSNVNSPSPSKPIWAQGLYGCGQIIGELDTGLYLDNVAFKDASQPPPYSSCNDGAGCPGIATPNYDARKVVAYYKWSGLSGGSWADPHGHGTHVAGSILGNDNVANPGTDCINFTTPGGDTNLDGMAPGAKLVMQETGSDLAYLNTQGGTAYHMAQIAYDNGARLHSDSWGGGCTDQFGACISGCTVTYDEFARDADRVMNDHDDLLLVFAAGNDATTCSNGNNVGSPGNAKNVLTIGATGRGTSGNNMASFSSRGPTLDARTKPDITAQGSSIVSAGRSANGTATMSGTSMATPTASGNAALVRDYLARGFYPSGQKNPADAITNPSGALVKAILTAGAFKMTGTGAGANPGQAQGFGRILLKDSLHFAGNQNRLFIHDEPAGLTTGGVQNHSLTVTGGQPLTIVLTWTDVAAALNASPATVNSLRLEVQAPNGEVWTQKLPAGYGVNNANPTQDTTTANYDNLNTMQRIRLETPALGTYQIRVRGINVPSGPQKYALAATGSFDISMDPDFGLSANPGSVAICAGSPAGFDVGVLSRYGFVDPVTLSVSGLPGAASGSFSGNPVTPADPAAVSHLTIGNTAGLARGSYGFEIAGTSSGTTPVSHNVAATLKVSVGIPANPALTAPADGATGTARSPAFAWAADAAAEGYTIEVATDSAFTSIVASGTPASNSWTPTTPLSPMTTYYWRVKANSLCGNSAYSATYSFTTGVTFPEPYCAVTFPSAIEPITRVKFTGIDNVSSATVGGSPAHEDFLGVAGGAVMAGETYQMVVEGNTAGSFTTKVNAFVDWNRDGTFDAAETYTIGDITNSTGTDGKQAIANIPVPTTATPGPVRLRVIKKYSSAATACNNSGYGQAEDYTLMVQASGATYTVGGSASGVVGSGLVLKLNGANDLPVAGNGAFTFPTALPDGSTYAVTVSASPAGQTCSVANGSGTIAGANVTNVAVTCATAATYTVGGTVSGLTGTGLKLKLNGANDLPISADGAFTFATGLTSGTAYAVTVGTQPSGQTCTVANGSGTIGAANVTNVTVTCAGAPPQNYTIGGRVTGLTTSGLVLQLNGGQTVTMNANGLYAFAPGLPSGATYDVTVQTHPAGQTCTVANGNGTVASANVTNVDVACAATIVDLIFTDGFEGTP